MRKRFRDERRTNIRLYWRDWLGLGLVVAGSLAGISLLSGTSQLVAAFCLGSSVTFLTVGWLLGGHVSSLTWARGAEGEQQTAGLLDQLGDEWSCEHSVQHPGGDWDHVLVGPAGVFLLDSKNLSGRATVSNDALHSGRLRYAGGKLRGAAVGLKSELAKLGVHGLYVQAVVVVWGEFQQREVEERQVVYIDGAALLDWLQQRPAKLSATRLAAARRALRALPAVS